MMFKGSKCLSPVGNVGPKSDHVEEWSGQEILYCRVGEGESQERKKQEGQGLKYPSVRLSMIWLVRILWFMLTGGWGRRRIQARLEAGPWPWKTEA
jgi:hypothetical protein